jgi:hypothetical protein
VFPETRRLVIDDQGTVSVYDTGSHRIFDVAQAQSAVSPAAVQVVLAALRSGGGRMAQFSQWSPGLSMVGDMFNTQLKAKLDALCSDIAEHLDSSPSECFFAIRSTRSPSFADIS